MVISLLKIPYVHRIYMYKYMVLANPIYTVYTVIRCIYGHIRYMEIPYTVWANLSIPESHVWSWENGPSCILRLHLMQCHVPSPPHAVPCPLSTTCIVMSPPHHMQCLVPSPPHAVPCPLPTSCSAMSLSTSCSNVPFPHLMLAVASKMNRTSTLLASSPLGPVDHERLPVCVCT